MPNNSEIWRAHIGSTEIDQFDVEYRVLGNIYWDNNAGFNYLLDTGAAHTDGIGTAIVVPKVLAVASGVEPSGKLNVEVLVKNLAFADRRGDRPGRDRGTTRCGRSQRGHAASAHSAADRARLAGREPAQRRNRVVDLPRCRRRCRGIIQPRRRRPDPVARGCWKPGRRS